MSIRTLTVRQLIEALEQYPAHAEVRIAHQPSWPFEYAVGGVASDIEIGAGLNDDAKAVWLVEGQLIGHFTLEAWRAVSKKKTRH